MSTSQVSVAVLVSAGRNPISGAKRACRGDAVALGVALKLGGARVRVIYAGDAGDASLEDYLSLGAQKVEVLPIADGRSALEALRAALAGIDLVLTGLRAEAGVGSGLLPYALAAALERPIVSNVMDVVVEGGEAQVRQFLPKGLRRRVSASLPAVLAIHPLAPVDLKYAYARRKSGRIDVLALESGASSPPETAAWKLEAGQRPPPRLKATEKKSGHARLQSAIVSEAKGGFVANEGTSVDKAQVMLSFLREHRLVDF